jgi:hypothetical protein
MKNYDFILILTCLFVFRIIMISGSYAEAICLVALLAYRVSFKYLDDKKLTNEVADKIIKDQELLNSQMKIVAEDASRAKQVSEGVKAAFNITRK